MPRLKNAARAARFTFSSSVARRDNQRRSVSKSAASSAPSANASTPSSAIA